MGQPRGDTGRVTAPAEQLRIDRNAAVDRITLAPNSWVDLVGGFVRDADAAFSQLHDSLAWQQTEVLRYDHYVPEKRLGVMPWARYCAECQARVDPKRNVARSKLTDYR